MSETEPRAALRELLAKAAPFVEAIAKNRMPFTATDIIDAVLIHKDIQALLAAPAVVREPVANILREVTSEWETTKGDNEVTCHHRMIEGVLCRWWGDGPTPKGVELIDRAAPPDAEAPKNSG